MFDVHKECEITSGELTELASRALVSAVEEAEHYSHATLTTGHLLVALYRVGGAVTVAMHNAGLSLDDLRGQLQRFVTRKGSCVVCISPDFKVVVDKAKQLCGTRRVWSSFLVSTSDLLNALNSFGWSLDATTMLNELCVPVADIQAELAKLYNEGSCAPDALPEEQPKTTKVITPVPPEAQSELEIERVWIVSTAHIPAASANVLSTTTTLIADEYDEGFWVQVPPIDADEMVELELELENKGFHPSVYHMITIARAKCVDWIRLDADGPIYDFLPVFHW